MIKKIFAKAIRYICTPPQPKFAKQGKNCMVSNIFDINKPQNIYLGDSVTLYNQARLICLGDNRIVFGNKIGPCINLTIIAGADVYIEDNVSIAGNVFISAGNHGMDPNLEDCYGEQPYIGKPIIVHHNSWIGQNVSILNGVEIGAYSIIGTGSVVTKDIPDYSIAVGNPAKVIKRFNFDLNRWEKV